MNNVHGRMVLGSVFGILILVFTLGGALWAQETEEPVKAETGSPVAEFSLVASAGPAVAAAEPLALASPAPAPQFIPRVTPQVIGAGVGFGDVAFKSSLVTVFALNLGDYFLTKACLKYAGTSEGNPMMSGIVKNPNVFAAVKVGASALSVFLLDKIYKKDKILGWVMSVAINSAMSYVVYHNYSVLQQMRGRAVLD